MKPIRFSIVTVVFNAAKTLEQTIKSVISQEFENYEYIIIDGGSTDGTLDIIKKYENNIAFWSSESDKGIYDAMNKGASAATGEFLNMLNSGDSYAHPGVLKTYDRVLSEHPDAVWAYGLAAVHREDGTPYEREGRQAIFGDGRNDRFYMSHICHQAVFYKKSLHDEFGPYDLSFPISADHHFMLKIYHNGHFKPAEIGEITIRFRKGGASETPGVIEDEKRAEDAVIGKSLRNEFSAVKKRLKLALKNFKDRHGWAASLLKFFRRLKIAVRPHNKGF